VDRSRKRFERNAQWQVTATGILLEAWGPLGASDSICADVAAAVVAMFDAGGTNTEATAYLETLAAQHLGARRANRDAVSALAAELHRAAADSSAPRPSA
jgi:hypothetical protein